MRTSYNDFDGILSRSEKKEQDRKLNNRIKNAKSLINNNCPQSYNVFRKLHNKSQINIISVRNKFYNKYI